MVPTPRSSRDRRTTLTNKCSSRRSSRLRLERCVVNSVKMSLFLLYRMKLPYVLIPRFNTHARASRRGIKPRVNMIARRLQRRGSPLLIKFLVSYTERRRARMFTNNFITRQDTLGLKNGAAGFIGQRRMRTAFLTSNRCRPLTGLKAGFHKGYRAALNVSFQHMHTRRRQERTNRRTISSNKTLLVDVNFAQILTLSRNSASFMLTKCASTG